tara:strand:- start:6179 stop:7054 length:876 start_codon:yes stop_codon:yes gene_type:complete
MKILKYLIEAIIIYILFFLFKIIGLNLSRKISSAIITKIGFIFRKKKIIKKNILNVFKNYSETEIDRLIKSMWLNYSNIFAEYIHLNKFRLNKFKEDYMEVQGIENLNKIKKNNKPAIFISGHFGNFELMAMELEKRDINLSAIYRPLNNIFLNPLMVYLRKKYICKNQIKKGLSGTRESIKFIQKNTSIALMVDQRVGESDRCPFFGIPAHTTSIPAQLAIKFDLEIFPIYLERKNDHSFYMEIQDPIKIQRSNNIEEDKKNITIKINEVIEKMVLRNPGQWIWTHSRWK